MPNTVYVDTSLLLAAFIAMSLASPPRWHCCKSSNGRKFASATGL